MAEPVGDYCTALLDPYDVDDGLKKTERWQIHSKTGGYLGTVKWFGRWRCYSFFVEDWSAAFEPKCLRAIADFCEAKTKAHRNIKEVKRDA